MKTIATLLTLALSPCAFADGMPIANGRFSGGEVTEIIVSPWQWAQLRLGDAYVLELTQTQSELIKRKSGSSISRVYIYNTRIGENDCTCCAENRALWFSEWKLEIPSAYVDSAVSMPLPNGTRQSMIILASFLVVSSTLVVWLWRRRRMRTGISNTMKLCEQVASSNH